MTCTVSHRLWTTEKEINFFLNVGLSNDVTQTIAGDTLQNNIAFANGGCFGVEGRLEVDPEKGQRTIFAFESATLDLGRWGKYRLPPVGSGWFDTVYLDDDLRVDVNSRDDILVCAAA